MGSDRPSVKWVDRRRPVSPFRSSPSEFLILILAATFYILNPNWPALKYGEIRARAALGEFTRNRLFGWTRGFRHRDDLESARSDIQRYQTELERTHAELRTLSIQVLENDALRALFLLPKRPEYRYVFGEVMSRSIRPVEARLTARVPESVPADLADGCPVIASVLPDWIAVGQVMDVKGDIAEIMLLSDPKSRIGVMSADTPAYGSALLMGRGLDRLELDYAAHPHFGRALAPFVRLVTSPESRFPPGLPVAELKPSGSGGGSENLQPSPLASFGDLQFIVILIPNTVQR